ncbi:MAG: hypothetical protein H0W40_17840 [Methylibium sp.]|uniref:hypothetical protein n=1 Tax=Methylibium sp. TaxID=2067992 RepID=UPI0017D60175|nr:hypothetical protein [Methylibium sp.]MBA3599216.1 hypothetical protein [Methylibium sp.]
MSMIRTEPAAGLTGEFALRRKTGATATTSRFSFIEEPTLEKTPHRPVMQIEATIGAEVLAGKELAVGARNKANELLVRHFFQLFGCNGATDPKIS